jgi:branched-chain amino acid transport system ATP-binding protein
MTALLELDGVKASYGPFRALFGVSIAVNSGSVTALLGANGAGKTTIARVCTGLVTPTEGAVRFDGQDFTGRKPYQFARAGIVHAVEGRSVFATLSVDENIALAVGRGRSRSDLAEVVARAYGLFPRLGERRRQVAGTLSGGEQRMLSLARVLVDRPRLLVADELSLGLAPIIVDDVYATLARIRESGTAILIVEQHVGHALALADDAVVLTKGEVSFAGPASEARSHIGL